MRWMRTSKEGQGFEGSGALGQKKQVMYENWNPLYKERMKRRKEGRLEGESKS